MDDWYKDGIIYQTHVRAFFDSNDDCIGDFNGLTGKLDYLQDLGINILWLLPFYPSPLKDDGYDIANYTAVNPSYGTLADFKALLKEAHRRGIRVVTELVVNHTSDQHPWFQKSRRAKRGSARRDFYVWSDTPDKYRDARIIFKDFETSNWAWDPDAHAYYWHRFFSHQPDLNFDNEAVHDALFKAFDFWMDMGVDAFRLDAIPYLYEREGTTCENLPETHGFLKKIRTHLDSKYSGRMLLAEANQWPEDSLPYFGNGDECHMAFHFPVMPRMYMALAMEDRFPIIDIMSQTPPIPPNCQWAMFLRNHDELTLEMVTDEDRDYMWRTYAKDTQARINLGIRRRLAPLLDNHRGRVHLMNGLLFSFPGTPIIYYGDEIGMGDNIYLGDRDAVSTPMQWSADRNAGFSRCNPQRLFLPVIIDPQFHYEQVNVEAQQASQYSLLWWMKRLIAVRKRYRAFGRGSMEFLQTENRKVLAYVRRHEDETILVVANLSRLVQCFELDLSQFRGMVPMELSGGTKFPIVTDRPYFLNLSPFGFYWFALQREAAAEISRGDAPLIAARTWDEIFATRNRDALERALRSYLPARRWFGGKARVITALHFRDAIEIPNGGRMLLVDVEFAEGEPQTYQLPLNIQILRREQDQARIPAIIARLSDGAILYEPVQEPAFANALLDTIARKKQLRGDRGTLAGTATRAFRELRGNEKLETHLMSGEQSNTAILFGQRLFLKLFRRLEPGINTDYEVLRFLNEETSFRNVPPLAGALEYQPGVVRASGAPLGDGRRAGGAHHSGEPMPAALLQGFTPNSGDAWSYTLDSIGRYFDRLLSDREAGEDVQTIGSYIVDAELLGVRTAQLHLALASRDDIRAFAPEPFTPHYQRSIYQSMRSQIVQTLQLVRRSLHVRAAALSGTAGAAGLSDAASRRATAEGSGRHTDIAADAQSLLAKENELHQRMRAVLNGKIDAQRIRTHGDYHLGQVLYTGNDFVIIDFEGEPGRRLSDPRIKRTALRDVAGMLRSFHYAPYAVVYGAAPGYDVRSEDVARLEDGARFWYRWVSSAFLRAYVEESSKGKFLPSRPEHVEVLLNAYLLEKALYEIVYELNNRPDWVRIPLRGVLELLS